MDHHLNSIPPGLYQPRDGHHFGYYDLEPRPFSTYDGDLAKEAPVARWPPPHHHQQVVMDLIEVFCPQPSTFPLHSAQHHYPYPPAPIDGAFNATTTQTVHGEFVLDLNTTALYEPLIKAELPALATPDNERGDASTRPKEVPGQCMHPECRTSLSYRGYCKAHGGTRRCMVLGCERGSQGKKRCIAHGGGKRCMAANCEKSSQSHGLCKAHGGGARCTFPHCDKSSQGKGRCRKHGGGRRCRFEGCDSGAQRDDLCAKHGGSRLCSVAGCGRTDRGGGLCEIHRRGLVCRERGCNRLGKSPEHNGYCLAHASRQNQRRGVAVGS